MSTPIGLRQKGPQTSVHPQERVWATVIGRVSGVVLPIALSPLHGDASAEEGEAVVNWGAIATKAHVSRGPASVNPESQTETVLSVDAFSRTQHQPL